VITLLQQRLLKLVASGVLNIIKTTMGPRG
jgi:hypothetical protein